MSQRYKSCVYKNCKSNRVINDGIGISLFKFPKDPERRKLWKILGNVPENTPERLLYMCSKHFDLKFMSVNNRRTMLIGFAVPFPSETLNETTNAPERAIQTITEEVESSENISQYNNRIDVGSNEQLNNILPAAPSPETINSNDDLIDSQNLSKFICNGTVYVKMRLDYYKREKQAMLNKIQRYEQKIAKIKNDVLELDEAFKT